MGNSGNPFENIRRVENSQELLDIAFSKSMKIKAPGGRMDGLSKSRSHEMNRINTAANVLVDRLERIVKNFPSLNLIHPFYYELADILTDLDSTKISLGRIFGIIKYIRDIEGEILENLSKTEIKIENKQFRKAAFGRYASIIKRIDNHLKQLETTRQSLIILPGFNPELPSVVIAGIPNSGKSSFIRLTTSGNPEIAHYPFTTRRLIFGHRNFEFLSVQFIDTPGLLDRPIDKRNTIELQAIAALKHLSDIMIFLIDPSPYANCTLEEQVNLLIEIKEFYSFLELIIVISKADLLDDIKLTQIKNYLILQNVISPSESLIRMHTINQNGADSILDRIDQILKTKIILDSKFDTIKSLEIAQDQLPAEDDPIWQ